MLNQDLTKFDSMLNVLKISSEKIKDTTISEAIHSLPLLNFTPQRESIIRSALLNDQKKYLFEKINDPNIRYFIAHYFYLKNYPNEALLYFQSLLEDKNANINLHGEAAYCISLIHFNQNSSVEFVKYCCMSADLGNIDAMISLGIYYFYLTEMGYDYDFLHKIFLQVSELNEKNDFLRFVASYLTGGETIQHNDIKAFLCFTAVWDNDIGAIKNQKLMPKIGRNEVSLDMTIKSFEVTWKTQHDLSFYLPIESFKIMLEPTFINKLTPLASLHLGLSCIKRIHLYHEKKIDLEQFELSLALFQGLFFNKKGIQSTLIHHHVFNAKWLPMLPLLNEKYVRLKEKHNEDYLANKFLTELKNEHQKFLLSPYQNNFFTKKNTGLFGLFSSPYSIQKTDIHQFFKHTLNAFDQKNRYTGMINKDPDIHFSFKP